MKKLDQSKGNVLGYEMKGKVTEKEFEDLSEEFKTAVTEHGKVRLLVRIPEIPGVEPGAMVEDLKLAPHASNIERYAILRDNRAAAGWVESLGNALIGGEIKHFEDSQYEEAWRWVQA